MAELVYFNTSVQCPFCKEITSHLRLGRSSLGRPIWGCPSCYRLLFVGPVDYGNMRRIQREYGVDDPKIIKVGE